MDSSHVLRRTSLSTKLILFSTLLTVVAVCVAFLLLSVELRRHTKAPLAETLGHHQKMILSLQQRSLEELLRTSTLMTDSPTLRAAMETYATEWSPAAAARHDLLATIRNEADKVAYDALSATGVVGNLELLLRSDGLAPDVRDRRWTGRHSRSIISV